MNVEDLTLDEIAEIERIAGQPMADLSNPAAMKGGLMKAVAYVVKKKTNPEFTMADAGRLTLGDLNAVMDGDPS